MKLKLIGSLIVLAGLFGSAGGSAICQAQTHPVAPRVAVLSEPDMPLWGSPLDLPAPVILETLRQEAIPAVAVSAADLADSSLFNAQRFTVLIINYGSSYPQAALANIHAFRSAGGCLVTSGFAFYQTCKHEEKEWKVVVEKVRPFEHGPEGVGTGIYRMLKSGSHPWMSVAPNPLGFKCDQPLGERERLTWLDRRTLAPKDELIPLLNLHDSGGNQYPAAALVRHHCNEFRGACDLWLGSFQLYYDITDRNVIRQLLCRGVLWCLKEKGQLDSTSYAAGLRRLDASKAIPELPAKLGYVESKRPWGESFLPKGNAPARKLMTVKTKGLTADECIALTCLQGLIARQQPRLWLIRSWHEKLDLQWLQEHKNGGFIDSWSQVPQWKKLFAEFKDSYRGAVVADAGLYRGNLLAVNVAMCEDLIVVTPELARELDIPIKIDLRGRFKTYAEGMRWVWGTYKNQFNRFVCDYMFPSRLADCVFDYDMQWRAPVIWIAGVKDAFQPGADTSDEFSIIGTMLAEMAPQSAVLGFPANGADGAGEPAGVQLVSRYGRGLVCTNAMANLSVTSGVHIAGLRQPTPSPLKFDKSKTYVAMVLSDGDNLNCWDAGFFHRYFEHPGYGRVPVGFTMGPELLELSPVVARWFYQHAAPNTEFICGVAGITYTAPSEFGTGFAYPVAAERDFYKWTARAMQAMGMRSLNITPGGTRELVASYARGLPFCHSMIYGWGRDSKAKLDSLAYTLPTGMAGFDSATPNHARADKEESKKDPLAAGKQMVADLIAMAKVSHAPCLYMLMANWSYNMDNLEYIGKNAPVQIQFVTPAQLADLYHQSQGNPCSRRILAFSKVGRE